MKRYCLIALALLSLNTGCIFGRSNSGRPGFFTSLHNRIHGTSAGAPCASGGCAQPVPYMPPMMPSAGIASDCATCGTETLGYPEYSSSEGYIPSGDTYLGETIMPAPVMQPVQGAN
jgi:hypothetical protein